MGNLGSGSGILQNIPLSGRYWSGTCDYESIDKAYYLYFDITLYPSDRYVHQFGHSVH